MLFPLDSTIIGIGKTLAENVGLSIYNTLDHLLIENTEKDSVTEILNEKNIIRVDQKTNQYYLNSEIQEMITKYESLMSIWNQEMMGLEGMHLHLLNSIQRLLRTQKYFAYLDSAHIQSYLCQNPGLGLLLLSTDSNVQFELHHPVLLMKDVLSYQYELKSKTPIVVHNCSYNSTVGFIKQKCNIFLPTVPPFFSPTFQTHLNTTDVHYSNAIDPSNPVKPTAYNLDIIDDYQLFCALRRHSTALMNRTDPLLNPPEQRKVTSEIQKRKRNIEESDVYCEKPKLQKRHNESHYSLRSKTRE